MSSLVHRNSKGCMELQLLRVWGLTHFHVSLCQFWNVRSCPRNIQRREVPLQSKVLPLIAFDRTHTIYVVYQSGGFNDVLMHGHFRLWPPSWTDWVTHLASISFWYRSDDLQDEIRVSQAALLRVFKSFRWNHVCSSWLAKRHANLSYKATKHSERTFLISNYYLSWKYSIWLRHLRWGSYFSRRTLESWRTLRWLQPSPWQ